MLLVRVRLRRPRVPPRLARTSRQAILPSDDFETMKAMITVG